MQDSFDVQSLAEYLHFNPDKIQKMAERGKIPGRRVGGQWQFSQAEVHHWLEERIGASDDQELAEVEVVLDRAASDGPAPKVVDLLDISAIDPQLTARSSNKVIENMCQLAAGTGMLWDPGKMADAVRAREQLHPTALDIGVALLHPRRPMANILGEPLLALGRTLRGIPFGGAQGRLTDLFFLICSVDDAGHLRVLARLSRLLSSPELLERLRSAVDGAEMLSALREHEELV